LSCILLFIAKYKRIKAINNDQVDLVSYTSPSLYQFVHSKIYYFYIVKFKIDTWIYFLKVTWPSLRGILHRQFHSPPRVRFTKKTL